MKDLIKLYDEYLKFINETEKGLVSLAYVHGWRCPDADVAKGIEYREKIGELKKKYGITD